MVRLWAVFCRLDAEEAVAVAVCAVAALAAQLLQKIQRGQHQRGKHGEIRRAVAPPEELPQHQEGEESGGWKVTAVLTGCKTHRHKQHKLIVLLGWHTQGGAKPYFPKKKSI